MSVSQELPITKYVSPLSTVAVWNGKPISYQQFLQHIHQIANALPGKAFAINLCEDRYLFLVSFFAVLSKSQTNLLPASKLSPHIESVIADFKESYVLADDPATTADYHMDAKKLSCKDVHGSDEEILIKQDHVAAVVFTSGSTGKPKPNIKTWGSLFKGAELAIKRFGFDKQKIQGIVATVPPQHMYGLETSVVVPMLAGIVTVCSVTFYPADIEAALKSVNGKCVLITTPIHLKACVNSAAEWNNIEFVISATAMMPKDLATKVEHTLHTKLYEIYGSSEFGSIATRRTIRQMHWTLYDDMQLTHKDGTIYIYGPQLKKEMPIHDVVEMKSAIEFELKGRHTDLIKIAGKRISLGELNQKLESIEGVIDGVFFIPQSMDNQVNQRLTAFVVAPGIDKNYILSELKNHIDAVFLPRPLILVKELPRNATGKIPQKELLSLYEACHVGS